MPVLWSLRTEQKWRQPIIVLFVFLVLFLVEKVGWVVPLQTVTLRLLQPFQLATVSLVRTFELPVRFIEAKQQEQEALVALQRSYAQALAKLSELETIKKENEALHQLLEKQGSNPQKKVLAAPIISYALTSIARGSDAGISVGQLVFIADTLVGRISAVNREQSTVILLASTDSEPILVETESHVQGLLVGTGKQVKLTQLPSQAVITKGERVTTIGQNGIPPGLFVGIVAAVDHNPTAPVQTVLIDQLNSFYTTAIVEVR